MGEEIEILEEMELEEFCRAVQKECVEVGGQWVIRLVYEDSTIKYLRNYAIPSDPDDEEVWYWPAVDACQGLLRHLEGDLLQKNVRLVHCGQTFEAAQRPSEDGVNTEVTYTGNTRIIIDITNPEQVANYEKWKAERPDVEPTIVGD